MDAVNIIISLLGALLAVTAFLLIICRRRLASMKVEKEEAKLESLRNLEECRKAESGLKVKVEELMKVSSELARAEARLENLEKQAERDKQELEKLQASFRLEFRNLANEILEEKASQFRRTNKEAMDNLMKPFRDNIIQFRERVEAIYSDENRQRGALQNEIKNLMELNRRITEETTNLTNALKGNSKVQGDWGEMILDTILESSNLVRGIHYSTQENFKGETGANLRPDVVLNLPDSKRIVIDSKVSLTAFVNHCEAEIEPEKKRFLDEHMQSLRRHITELGSKRYQELVDSPDFVIMFVANEPAFLAALQYDSSLWSEAYNKKVIVSSPTNLFALLKIVDDLWKRDSQNRNAVEIAEEGAKLYDKFVGFVETLEAVGKGLDSTMQNYGRAIKQLSTGPGNLVGRTEKLRKLGLRATKALSPRFISGDAELTESGDEPVRDGVRPEPQIPRPDGDL